VTRRLQVVHELRKRQEAEQQALVCEASSEEAGTAYERALKASMHKPDAEHPVEAFGVEGVSMTATRRKVCFLHWKNTAFLTFVDLFSSKCGCMHFSCMIQMQHIQWRCERSQYAHTSLPAAQISCHCQVGLHSTALLRSCRCIFCVQPAPVHCVMLVL
jgi:hypothetical protein